MKNLLLLICLLPALVFAQEPTPTPTAIPIPNLAKWESQMVQYATPLCNEAAINAALTSSTQDERNVWYYDGTRTFQQVANYTGNPDWNRCAGYVANAYMTYVTGFRTGGWRVFPHGLYDYFVRTQDQRASVALHDLATISAFADKPPDPAWSNSWEYSREIAYILQSYIYHTKIDGAVHSQLSLALGDALGHMDQWFVTKTAPIVKPFMVGLTAEALITYYEQVEQDPRILPAIRTAADWMWTNAWVPSARAFKYGAGKCSGKYGRECSQPPAADLNMLIAPMYAWLWKQTGEAKYLEQGDQAFSGAVDLAWLGQGKQFNQTYRWSFKYVEWRK